MPRRSSKRTQRSTVYFPLPEKYAVTLTFTAQRCAIHKAPTGNGIGITHTASFGHQDSTVFGGAWPSCAAAPRASPPASPWP